MKGETRLTAQARSALRLAWAAASELGHAYVGTEHLLLGLERERAGSACRALCAHGLGAERLLPGVEADRKSVV